MSSCGMPRMDNQHLPLVFVHRRLRPHSPTTAADDDKQRRPLQSKALESSLTPLLFAYHHLRISSSSAHSQLTTNGNNDNLAPIPPSPPLPHLHPPRPPNPRRTRLLQTPRHHAKSHPKGNKKGISIQIARISPGQKQGGGGCGEVRRDCLRVRGVDG